MGDLLIRAGPGTGKTRELIRRIIELVKDKGVDPSKILCITYTNSAVEEIRQRLRKELDTDGSKVEVHTFHSFALSQLDQTDLEMIDDTVKKFVIYRSLVDRNVFSYSENYLQKNFLESIVSLIDYLRCYDVTVDKIEQHKREIIDRLTSLEKKEHGSYTVEDYKNFLNHLINVYKDYESFKTENGYYDYTDMLYMFIKQHKETVFDYDYVFVDELQDANILEAKVVRIAANKYNNKRETQLFLVGDAKQSIFGFQGGSLVNFKEFGEECDEVRELTKNYRSYQKIIDYSAEFLAKNSENRKMIEEAKNLRAVHRESEGEVYYKLVNEDNRFAMIKHIVENRGENTVGIITRTNAQAEEISEYLTEQGISHSCSAPMTGSQIVKEGVINLLDAIFHYYDPGKLAKGLSSPFSGVNMCELIRAYAEARKNGRPLTFADIEKNESFRRFVDMVKLIDYKRGEERDFTKNLKTLFERYVLPVSVAFGESGMLTSIKLYNAIITYCKHPGTVKPYDILLYLSLVDVSEEKRFTNEEVSVLTAHKAKGLTYDIVVYLPSVTRSKYRLVENIGHAILSSINPKYDKEEIDEESVRVDYVAFTRARKKLFILLPDKKNIKDRYVLSSIDEYTYDPGSDGGRPDKRFELSYGLLFSHMVDYLNGNEDEDALLNTLRSFKSRCQSGHNGWIKQWLSDRLKEEFRTVSYSSLTSSPVDILIRLFGISEESNQAMDLGSKIHRFYYHMFKNKKQPETDDEKFWFDRWTVCFNELKTSDPKITQIDAECPIVINREDIEEIFGYCPDWVEGLKGRIDALFKGNDLWIVDYKTGRSENNSEYRPQLMLYRELYAKTNGIPSDRIRLALFYVLLRRPVNDEDGNPVYYSKTVKVNGNTDKVEKMKQKFVDRLKRIDEYVNNPDTFIQDLKDDLEKSYWMVPHRDLVTRFIEEYELF